jgi:putative transposase
MPRNPRLVLTSVVHHVVARGVNRQRLFRHGFDKTKYLKRFSEIAEEEKVLVHGYCLMDNHVHWLLTPMTPNGLARLFRRAHTWWAMVFNRKENRCGHLFQNRFHSSPLGEDHYWTALRYVEVNPRRAASRPCGSVEWIRNLECTHNRKLAWSPPGRPAAARTFSTA